MIRLIILATVATLVLGQKNCDPTIPDADVILTNPNVPDDFPMLLKSKVADVYFTGVVSEKDLSNEDGLYIAFISPYGYPLELQVKPEGELKAYNCEDKLHYNYEHNEKLGYRCKEGKQDVSNIKLLDDGLNTVTFDVKSGETYKFFVCLRDQNAVVLLDGREVFKGHFLDLSKLQQVSIGGFADPRVFTIKNYDPESNPECVMP